MPWGKSLAEINSVSFEDLHEYSSRPNEAVLNLVSKRKDDSIVIYGASGKWMSDLTEMLLRALMETGKRTEVHLVARFRKRDEFEQRFSKYPHVRHEIDFTKVNSGALERIPSNATWVIYGLGYKFRTNESDEEYARLCRMYGNEIPAMIIEHHNSGADIVVMGSANGVELSPVDKQAKDDAPLVPKPGNLYGISIRDKENTVKKFLGASKAVILRGGYMTDLTYGGIEQIVMSVRDEKVLDLSKLTYFNILGHRDASIYSLLSVTSASNPVTTLNLSGHTADVREIALEAGKAFKKEVHFEGEPKQLHLLIDGSKIESLYGKPIDSLQDLIKAQIFWIKNGGYSRGIDHHVGESM